ncbi:ECF transporter S component [Mucilaginibacter aquatilis]|uniref:ECF transporter S component n=1 Tax=Mucilaginibacter aquatilis TaxID=1517760 RepID=A0A6I4IC81_9SPHI|nr:ECF transporter S component [Mucilaginibacter aquatilis]MVN91468.1 ECF transporter S component [Mucilaginibacter aquatilis]
MSNNWTLGKTAVVAALTGLSALGTMIIRVPIPVTNGYFNIGDVFVVLAGLWLGPVPGLIVGLVGPTVADAVGFPQFILATAIIKGLEGFVVGLIGRHRGIGVGRRVIAASVGGFIIVAGYFLFEAYIYPYLGSYVPFFKVTDIGGAIVEVPANIAQAVIAVAGGVALWRPLAGSARPDE